MHSVTDRQTDRQRHHDAKSNHTAGTHYVRSTKNKTKFTKLQLVTYAVKLKLLGSAVTK